MKKESDFFEQVWQVVELIPRGRVTSYGAIARYLGSPQASRTVGYAMNASHASTVKVPAHRVVNRNGLLTGKHWFGGSEVMQQLLESEGIAVMNDKIIDFEKYFWDPMKELG
jgi:methylated-DNA-protein-cysteine methyltransferase related protein